MLIWLTSSAMMQKAPEPRVVLCIGGGPASTAAAEAISTGLYESIGVRLEWRYCSRDCPEDAIRIRLTTETPQDLAPGALAYTTPYGAAEIRVFYDRLTSYGMYQRSLTTALLGHVLAHEIGHVLQGVNRHSTEGVMKAKWEARDIFDMARQPFPFARIDAQLIHLGLEARARRAIKSASGRTVPPS